MKQKEIIIRGQISSKAKNLIKEYFAVKRVNEIEGFILSEEDFLNKYKETPVYKEFRSASFCMIYTIHNCDICWQPYDELILSRKHLYAYLEASYRLCDNCKEFHYGLGEVLGIKLDGDIAS